MAACRHAPRPFFVLVLLTGFAIAPAAASGHGAVASSVEAHLEEDAVALTPATERRLERRTAAATSADAEEAAGTVPDDPGEVGEWGPVMDWPLVGVHVALLPNGKVLAYASVGDNPTESYEVHDHTRATVWDPADGSHTPANVKDFNLFCSGLSHLTDGSLFLAGGNLDKSFAGIRQTHLFDSDTNTWTRGPDMAAGRWYPSVTPLGNGEQLITEGGPDMPEVRTTDGSLRALSTASLDLPLYPWIDVAPDGRAFYSGPDATMRALDPAGTGAWQSFGQRDTLNRDYGSRALYDVGKILVSGGAHSSNDSRVIDLNGATPQVTPTESMATGRRQHNLTVLADGNVLATGGNSSGAGLVDVDNGVYPAELWDPATGQWQTLASMQVTRQYHSTALLLPDGRLLSAGGGMCGACVEQDYLAKNAEIFSPPYLFEDDGSGDLAERPEITVAPTRVGWHEEFSVSSPDAASISKLALVRLGSVTHSVNMEQRYVPLDFTAESGTLSVTSPENENVAPPGIYMLFAIDSEGVPSVAEMVRVSLPNQEPSARITSPDEGDVYPRLSRIAIRAAASDPDGAVEKVTFHRNRAKLGVDRIAPYSFRWKDAKPGRHTLTVRASDDEGAKVTSDGVRIRVRRPR